MMYQDADGKIPEPKCVNCDMKKNCCAPDCRFWQEKHNYEIHDDETQEEAIFSLEYELFWRNRK